MARAKLGVCNWRATGAQVSAPSVLTDMPSPAAVNNWEGTSGFSARVLTSPRSRPPTAGCQVAPPSVLLWTKFGRPVPAA